MKQPAEKNFYIFISLLLEGVGAGLILIPSHIGLTGGTVNGLMHGIAGLFCFFTALSIQISTVWDLSKRKNLLIRGAAFFLLIATSGMFMQNRQYSGAAALLIGGAMQLIAILPFNQGFLKKGLFHFTIALVTFGTGMVLPFFNFDFSLATPYIPYLSAVFLITAFIACIPIVVPSVKYSALLNQLQLIPWAAIMLIFILTKNNNLVTPTAVIAMLLLEKVIPWERLTVPEDDILSRRVIMIALFVETAHLIFLGALLFIIDPGYTNESGSILTAREATFIFFILFSVMIYYVVTTVIMTISGLIETLNRTGDDSEETSETAENMTQQWSRRLEKYIKPFIMTPEGVRGRIQVDQISRLTRQTTIEKKRNAQLTLLLELSQQLENQLDQPVSAQLAVNTLERAINCGLALIFIHEHEKKEFMLLAAAGNQKHLVPAEYRQDAAKGVIGRALRQRKTQIVNNTRLDPDFIAFKGENNLSLVVIPLIYNGHVHGAITINNEQVNAFGGLEIGLAETVAGELTRAWERSGYHQRLMDLIQTGSQLTSAPDPETTAQEVVSISRNIVQAKFTYIYMQLGQERNLIQRTHSGTSPLLLASLTDPVASADLFKLALQASQPFRIRDVRRYEKTVKLKLDHNGLRCLLVIPIRWQHVNIGAIFAFGKQNEVFFTENDESLAELISIQAGGAFESTWLQQELRGTLRITSLLYRLSNQIIQAENIEDAVSDIAQTAHKLGKNFTTGIVLFNTEDKIIADTLLDEEGNLVDSEHPMNLIRDAMVSGQMISFSPRDSILRTCLPIQTPIRAYGAIWMDSPDDPAKPNTNPNDLQALVNQAAIALERSLLLVESRRQAKEIKAAYYTLEATYDQTLVSLSSALDARDRETEGHSMRVTHLAVKLGEELGYSQEQLKILERGSILHDIGKIGVSDTILHKPGPLTEDEWMIMRLHPDIGSKIVIGIPFLQDTIPLIKHHQERWDGSGYPGGLSGTDIPELARLFSIIDAFDALTSNRPYRQKISKEEALEYLREMSGIHFDPAMVIAFEDLVTKKPELISTLGE